MKNVNRILIVLVLFYLVLTTVIVNHVFLGDALFYPRRSPWKLVWRDEFNGSALDITKWTTFNQGTNINHELQAYIDDNVTVRNGCLTLACRRQDWTGPDANRPGEAVTRHFTSAQIDTVGKKDWTYGRFEIRARFPHGRGLTPYIGLFSADHWPPEIGMGIPGGYPHQLFMINHWLNDTKPVQDDADLESTMDYSDGFHTYVIEWEPGAIRWIIDGEQKYRVTRHVPNEPLILLLRNPVGGDYSVDPGGRLEKGEVPAEFPQFYRADWIRVYQRR